MKNTLIRALAALVTVMLLLTGCNLITVDEEMQAAEDAAAREKDYATVLVEFADGTTITKGDVINVYNDNYSYYAYLYSAYYNQIPSDLSDYVKNEVVEAYIAQEVVKKHASDYGVEQTEEMTQQATEDTDTEWEQIISNYIDSDAEDQEAAREEAIATVEALGYTYDYVMKEHLDSVFVTAVQDAVKTEVTEVTDEQLQASYDEKVAADEETYSADTSAFETAMKDGTTVYWNPEGYRGVQHILVKPSDEDLLTKYKEISTELSTLQSELMELVSETNTSGTDAEATEAPTEAPEEDVRDMSAVRDEINAKNEELKAVEAEILADCQDTIDEIQGKLDDGAAFPDLIDEYTADSDALFYVSDSTTSLITPFKQGAMALEKVGDVSEPVVGEYGVHLIYYAVEVPAGAVALDDVREALTEATLSELQQAHYDELLEQWTEEAGVTTHLDRWAD